jgi:tRNA (guanine37-N1)-methyltransferase
MRIDVLTIFPRIVEAPLSDGIVQRAREAGIADLRFHDLREHTDDKHRSVDDAPFGGGPGMVLKAEPILRAFEAIWPEGKTERDAVVLLTPRGRRFDQATARRYAGLDRLFLLCGRYEGIDERVPLLLGAEELSLGDFVLTGGEVAALAVIEATVRLLPGALGDEGSAAADSFAEGLLDWPHYTRPAEVRGRKVPEALLSGDHGKIRRWRRREALRTTRERRPDLLQAKRLSAEDERLLREIDARSEAPRSAGAGLTPAEAGLDNGGRARTGDDEHEMAPGESRAPDNQAAALHK